MEFEVWEIVGSWFGALVLGWGLHWITTLDNGPNIKNRKEK